LESHLIYLLRRVRDKYLDPSLKAGLAGHIRATAQNPPNHTRKKKLCKKYALREKMGIFSGGKRKTS
jgi:hypothetical protein